MLRLMHFYVKLLLHSSGPGSSVDMATDYEMDGPGTDQAALSSATVRMCCAPQLYTVRINSRCCVVFVVINSVEV